MRNHICASGFSALALLLLGACSRAEPERARRVATADVAAAPLQDTTFTGTTAATHRPRPPRPPRPPQPGPPEVLRAAQASAHPGFDRVVFEFTGDSLPGYHIEYASRPVVRCGSGEPVSVAGTARLVVRLEPARAHDERGNASVERRAWSPGLPAVKEMKLICDFEGQVEWVLGVAAARPYRVLETGAPGGGRLIIDLRHAP